jgi:hypothetical protein
VSFSFSEGSFAKETCLVFRSGVHGVLGTFNTLRTELFVRKIQKMHFSPKMEESKNKWYHQKVLSGAFQ